jgi:Mg-chelatase subunit ChlD
MGIFSRNSSSHQAPSGAARTVNLVKDAAGTPAVDLTKASDAGHVDLVKRAQKAGISLSKRGLAGIRAQAVLVLDHSGSMHGDYKSGKVQTLVERVLGFALQIDVDGVVPVIPFDANVRPTVNVGLAAGRDVVEYRDVVNRHIWQRNMGTTNLAAALHVVRGMATTTDAPIFCVVVTDGCPDNRRTATELVVDLARYPVFVKFLAIRDVPYLRELDDMPADRRLLDNVDSKAFADPAAVSDLAFADAMADEWDTWVAAAMAAGVLR